MATLGHLSIIFTGFTPPRMSVNTSTSSFLNSSVNYREADTVTFDQSVFTNTIVTEFGLVGDRAALFPILTSTYMLAIGLANIVAGE